MAIALYKSTALLLVVSSSQQLAYFYNVTGFDFMTSFQTLGEHCNGFYHTNEKEVFVQL